MTPENLVKRELNKMKEYIYLWLNKYIRAGKDRDGNERHLFENVGIPLSSKYRVDFDCKELSINGITGVSNYDGDYFCTDPQKIIIKDIVALVGNNGCGKSCFLDLFKKIITRDQIGDDSDAEYILIYIDCENGKDNKSYKVFCSTNEVDIRLKVNEKLRIERCNGDEISNEKEYKSDFVISYSPFFDTDKYGNTLGSGAQFGGSADISTAKLIDVYSSDLHNSMENRENIDRLDSYSLYEQQVELEFLAEFLDAGEKLQIDLPKEMYLQANDYQVDWVVKKLENKENGRAKSLKSQEESPNEKIIDEERLKKERLLDIIKKWRKKEDLESKIYLSVFACLFNSDGKRSDYLLNCITKNPDIKDAVHRLTSDIEDNLRELIVLIESTSEKADDGKYLFRIKEKKDALTKIMRSHYIIKKDYSLLVPFLLFRRQKLSTGETNFIQLFARFYHIWKASKKQVGDVLDANDIIFLIDEGEANFHPDWQRKYIRNLIIWVESIMTRLKENAVIDEIPKFQIIISTHSPFVVCDLPRNNVVRLRLKNADVRAVEVCKSNGGKTGIGAYVTELLKDGFFLKSMMGAFAEDNINALIKETRIGRKLSKKSQFVLDELGDKFLKNILRKSK